MPTCRGVARSAKTEARKGEKSALTELFVIRTSDFFGYLGVSSFVIQWNAVLCGRSPDALARSGRRPKLAERRAKRAT